MKTLEQRTKALDALVKDGLTQGEALVYFSLKGRAEDEDLDAFTAAAREEADDELEIDDEPMHSRGEGGCWVSAWVWVSDDEADIPQPCDGCDECHPKGVLEHGLCPACCDAEGEGEEEDLSPQLDGD